MDEENRQENSEEMGRVRQFRTFLGIDEVCGGGDNAGVSLWRALPAEFLGTALLVLVGCGSCIGGWGESSPPTVVQIALSFGLTVATIVQGICRISGGHINPGVTAGMLVTGRCPLIRSVLYIAMQCLGAIAGSAVLQSVTPVTEPKSRLGLTALSSNLSEVQGAAIEFLITFVLVFTVFAVCDENRIDVLGSAPLAIGLSVTACHLWALQLTGSSMNSARAFGPAVILGEWKNHWIYWVGPILGGMAAGLIYQSLFLAPPPDKEELERARMRSLAQYNDKDSDRTTSI